MTIRSKAQTLLWYLQRPPLYKELVRKVVRRQFTTDRSSAERAEALAAGQRWCAENQREAADLLAAIGREVPQTPVSELHPGQWREAEAAVDACPVKMGGPANVDVLYRVTKALQPKVVVETGVANGWSTTALLLAMNDVPGSKLVSVDMPYAKMENEQWVGCAVPSSLRSSWTLIRLPDRDALPQIFREHQTIDLLHYDSDKSPEGRKFAYELAWPRIRQGGLLMSDDVEDNLAFRDFAIHVGAEPFVLAKTKPNNYAGVLLKR